MATPASLTAIEHCTGESEGDLPIFIKEILSA